jgi:hypothetical protein
VSNQYNPAAGIQVNRRQNDNSLKCKECKCQWFMELQVAKYREDIYALPGARQVTLDGNSPIYVYVCLNCGTPIPASQHYMGVDPDRGRLTEIIQILQAKANAPQQPE